MPFSSNSPTLSLSLSLYNDKIKVAPEKEENCPKKIVLPRFTFQSFFFRKESPLHSTPYALHPPPPFPSPRASFASPFHIPRNFQAHLSTTVSTAAPADGIRVNGGRFWIHWVPHKGTSEISTLAPTGDEVGRRGGGAGELMACAPWIKCPGEKARHLGSLPRPCADNGRGTGGKDCGKQK